MRSPASSIGTSDSFSEKRNPFIGSINIFYYALMVEWNLVYTHDFTDGSLNEHRKSFSQVPGGYS